MLDRVGLLMPRLSRAGRDPELATADALRDLRTGVNIIDLEEIVSGLRTSAHATRRRGCSMVLPGISAASHAGGANRLRLLCSKVSMF